MHATFNKHKVPDVLNKIKLMLPTSAISTLLGEVKPNVVLGEKDQLSLTLFLKDPLTGSCVAQAWNVTADIYKALTAPRTVIFNLFTYIAPFNPHCGPKS